MRVEAYRTELTIHPLCGPRFAARGRCSCLAAGSLVILPDEIARLDTESGTKARSEFNFGIQLTEKIFKDLIANQASRLTCR